MKNDTIVCFVCIVAVAEPVAGAQMNLHITSQNSVADAYLGIEEIWSCICVCQSRVDDFQLLPVGCEQSPERKKFVLPHIMQQFLHDVWRMPILKNT